MNALKSKYLNTIERYRKKLLNRLFIDRANKTWMYFSLFLVVLLPVLLIIGLYFKSVPIFESHSIFHLITSSNWRPLSGEFGFLTFIVSSLWVSFLALLFSAPICLLTGIFLTQYAHGAILRIMHPIIDILAGIPSVVFGAWGVILVVPFVSDHLAPLFGVETSGYTILSGAIVLSIMIIPFILNILIEIFKTIPIELTEVSFSLGASRWQTIKLVLLRKIYPGIVSAFGLGLSRAFGETIAVLMVVGNVAKIPSGAFQPGYPLPALIANNYGEMMSIPLYDSALMLAALILFAIVLLFNFLSRLAINRFRKT